jgi:hypothetical protein
VVDNHEAAQEDFGGILEGFAIAVLGRFFGALQKLARGLNDVRILNLDHQFLKRHGRRLVETRRDKFLERRGKLDLAPPTKRMSTSGKNKSSNIKREK